MEQVLIDAASVLLGVFLFESCKWFFKKKRRTISVELLNENFVELNSPLKNCNEGQIDAACSLLRVYPKHMWTNRVRAVYLPDDKLAGGQ